MDSRPCGPLCVACAIKFILYILYNAGSLVYAFLLCPYTHASTLLARVCVCVFARQPYEGEYAHGHFHSLLCDTTVQYNCTHYTHIWCRVCCCTRTGAPSMCDNIPSWAHSVLATAIYANSHDTTKIILRQRDWKHIYLCCAYICGTITTYGT